MRRLFLLLPIFILIIVASAWILSERAMGVGTTYYMRADGTAANKVSATSCSSASTAMSVATHNGETFSAGDTIILCDDGGDYASTIIIPSSGSSGAGNTISYQPESGAAPVIDLNYATDYAIRSINKSYISVSGLTLRKAREALVRLSDTGAGSSTNITLDDMTYGETWANSVWVDGASEADRITNITITDSTFTDWGVALQNSTTCTANDVPYPCCSGVGAGTCAWDIDYSGTGNIDNTDSQHQRAGIAVVYADTVSIAKNRLDDDSYPACTIGTEKLPNGISVLSSINAVVEGNYVSVCDHGIHLKSSDGMATCSDGTGNIIRYNFVQAGDDCLTTFEQLNSPLWYGNVCISTGDDGFNILGDNGGTCTATGKLLNNIIIGFDSAGINPKYKAAMTVKNNIFQSALNCYVNSDLTPSPPTFPCMMVFEDTLNSGYPTLAGNTIDYNQYYDSNGGALAAFVASDLDYGTAGFDDNPNGSTIVASFSQWQQDNVAPDSHGAWDRNPQLDPATGDCTAYTDLIAGEDLSGTFTQLLAHGATWVVGQMPALETVTTWTTGAYNTTNCPTRTYFLDGVTIDGVTIN